MNKVVITYTDRSGCKEKVEVPGDFQVGRDKTVEGPMVTFALDGGTLHHLTACPRTISRLVLGTGKECESCHARFFWENNRFFVQDMGSTNGTMINGKTLPGWDKKQKSDPVEITSTSEIRLGEFDLTIEPIVPKPQASPIIKQLGLEPVLSQAQTNGGGPIIINIQNLDAGHHKNIGSIDVVANRSRVDIDGDDDEEMERPPARRERQDVDVVATRSDVRIGPNGEKKEKKRKIDIEFDEDMF
ncbi:MAG: FHA domain-containing protein [Thermoplasmatota archaeon]